jgi:hypothetical protein
MPSMNAVLDQMAQQLYTRYHSWLRDCNGFCSC